MKLHISGEVTVPGDKSLTHRALMLSAVARGTSVLRGLLSGADCQSTAAVLRALGCPVPRIPPGGEEVRIDSPGIDGWKGPTEVLDCGNSGTTVRLMMGLLAGRSFCSRLTGDDSLRRRPMRRITEPLSRMGAQVRELDQTDRLPVELCGGRLHALQHRSPKASAQIKSAVLFAGLSGGVPVTVWEPEQSRDHSERMLRALGVSIGEGAEADGTWRVDLQPGTAALPPLEMEVPGDPSSAAFLIALALLSDSGQLVVTNVGTNPTRTGFFRAVERMGGRVATESARVAGGEPVADLVAGPARLRGIEVHGAEVPSMIDEIPMLSVLAARAAGETHIRGAEELRAKESDRIVAIVENLRAIGAEAEELPDGLVVRGSDRPLIGRVRTFHDHRIAMAFGILGALPGNSIEIDAPEAVDISYPQFWGTLRSLATAHDGPNSRG